MVCGFSLGFGAYSCLFRVCADDTLDYGVLAYPIGWKSFAICGVLGAALTLGLQSLFSQRQKVEGSSEQSSWIFLSAIFPLLFLLLLIADTPSFPSMMACIFIISIACFRFMAAWPGKPPFEGITMSKLGTWFILLSMIAFSIVYGYLLQIDAYNTLNLCADWDIFLNVVDNTLRGNWFYCDMLGRSFFGQHFEPGMVLLLAPWIWLFRSAETLFAINAVALYIGGIGIYALARTKGCGRGEALILSAIYTLHPSLSAMTVCLFYGFHESQLVLPVVIFFFLSLEKGWRKTAIALLILSLSIKETVAPLWFCTGLVIALDKERRKLGFLIAVGSLAYFFLAEGVIIPAIAGAKYEYIDMYYANLGSSVMEIALSPILKPGVFWGLLLRYNNFYFLGLFLLPAFISSSYKWKYYLGFAGILGFLFLKGSNELTNINSWYQCEMLALLGVCSVFGFVSLSGLDGSQRPFPLAWGLGKAAFPSKKLGHAALAGTFLAAALCFWMFALGCLFGKNHLVKANMTAQDFTGDIERWKSYIPEGMPLTCTTKIGAHFILSNQVSRLNSPLADYVFLDLADCLSLSDIERFWKRFLHDKAYSLIHFENIKSHVWLLFKKKAVHGASVQTTFKVSESEWNETGIKVADNGFVTVRVMTANGIPASQPGLNPVFLFFRLDKGTDKDLMFRIKSISYEERIHRISEMIFPFGFGSIPISAAEPGDTFQVGLELPSSGQFSLEVKIEEPPEPEVN